MSFPAEALIPVFLGLVYARRVTKLRDLGREPALWRQLSFAGGLLLIMATEVTPLGELSLELVWAHMVTHTLITDQAALLLALGLTGPVLGPIVSAPVIRRLVVLISPPAALILWVALIGAWHTPALYQAAASNGLAHFLEHSSFLAAGLTVWLTVLGPFPQPAWFGGGARVGFVVVVHLFGMALANAMMFSGTVFYPDYAETALARGMDPLTDQGVAGAILMGQGFAVMLGVLAFELLRWAKQDTERQDLLDYAWMHGLELDEARTERAARAGRTGMLRERLDEELRARDG